MGLGSTLVRLGAALLIGGSAAAWLPGGETFERGYLVDEQTLGQVKAGMSGEQVLQILGTPSTVSTVGNRNWYYISQTSRRPVRFLGETLVDQKVTAVYFTPGLRVERVALYGLKDGRVFDFVSRSTPSGGGDQNFVGQLFRDVRGEEARVGVGEPVELVPHGRQDVRVPVPERGHRRAAGRVDVVPPVPVADQAPGPARRHGIVLRERAVEDARGGHGCPAKGLGARGTAMSGRPAAVKPPGSAGTA